MLNDIFTKSKDGKAVNMNFSHIFTTSKSYCKGMFSCSVLLKTLWMPVEMVYYDSLHIHV